MERKKTSSRKSSAKKNVSQETEEKEIITATDSGVQHDSRDADLHEALQNENQEYVNAELENRRANKKLNSGRSTKRNSVKTARLGGKEGKEKNSRSSESREKNENGTAAERNGSFNRSRRLMNKATYRNRVERDERPGKHHWRKRSAKYLSSDRSYERGFKDGFRKAMEELSGKVTTRHPSDGDFRYNERSRDILDLDDRTDIRTEHSSNVERDEYPPVHNQGIRKDKRGHIHMEEHPTGRFFIEQFAGGSAPYNPKFSRIKSKARHDSIMTSTGRKRMH